MRKFSLILSLLCLFSWQAQAIESIALEKVPNAEQVGKARMNYLLWEVYDISLYAPNGKWDEQKPYALNLHYLMSLDGEKIAERSAEEMRKSGCKDEMKIAAWFTQMKQIFPDVHKGDEIIGVYVPNAPTKFYYNGKFQGEVQDPEFGESFFGIWLSPKTSEPELRQKILGLK